jgi:hypothetical protein
MLLRLQSRTTGTPPQYSTSAVNVGVHFAPLVWCLGVLDSLFDKDPVAHDKLPAMKPPSVQLNLPFVPGTYQAQVWSTGNSHQCNAPDNPVVEHVKEAVWKGMLRAEHTFPFPTRRCRQRQ